MSETNWWNGIQLPRTLGEWRWQELTATLTAKVLNPAWSPTEPQAVAKYVDETIDIHGLSLRQVSSFSSASGISHGHFLLLRTLWRFHGAESLYAEASEPITRVSHEADEVSRSYLDGDPDWQRYLDDIQINGANRPLLGRAANVGSFTGARHFQLHIVEDEGSIKFALVQFLSAIIRSCPQNRLFFVPGNWYFEGRLGMADIAGQTDGHLTALEERPPVFGMLAITPFLLSNDPVSMAALRQMAMNMVAWIACSLSNNEGIDRFWMVSQHLNEIYLTFADFDEQQYKDYLLGTGGESNADQLGDKDFLKLHCFGPFNIYNHEHMASVGRMILALAVDISSRHIPAGNASS